jgi:hypothetical protein
MDVTHAQIKIVTAVHVWKVSVNVTMAGAVQIVMLTYAQILIVKMVLV